MEWRWGRRGGHGTGCAQGLRRGLLLPGVDGEGTFPSLRARVWEPVSCLPSDVPGAARLRAELPPERRAPPTGSPPCWAFQAFCFLQSPLVFPRIYVSNHGACVGISQKEPELFCQVRVDGFLQIAQLELPLQAKAAYPD